MKELKELAEKGNIPVAMTLLGVGCLPNSHHLNLGMMGMHGEAEANHAIQEADLLIACGMRFDDRVTGNLKTYSPNSKKIHIEIDASEINKNVRVDVGINADLATVLRQINSGVTDRNRAEWWGTIKDWQEESNQRDILQFESPTLLAAQAIRKIWEVTKGDAYVVTDVGQHQMLECQYYGHEDPHTLSTSGGSGDNGIQCPCRYWSQLSRKRIVRFG